MWVRGQGGARMKRALRVEIRDGLVNTGVHDRMVSGVSFFLKYAV